MNHNSGSAMDKFAAMCYEMGKWDIYGLDKLLGELEDGNVSKKGLPDLLKKMEPLVAKAIEGRKREWDLWKDELYALVDDYMDDYKK